MRRLAANENKLVVAVPKVIRLTIVRVEPQLVTITIHVEHVRVTIGVVFVQDTIYTTTS